VRARQVVCEQGLGNRGTIWGVLVHQMEFHMSTPTLAKSHPTPLRRVAVAKLATAAPKHFWDFAIPPRTADGDVPRRSLQTLVRRVIASDDMQLFDAIEQGVPPCVVDMIAAATHEPTAWVMDIIGVAPTTFKRKEEAGESLPEAAGQRVMGLLRVMATLRRALDESGDAEQLASFDLEAWLARWLKEPLAELKNKTPAEMLRNAQGQRALEQVIERMRGGLPA
jgi:putative toxin-antitoxin system antitoxin component (TIGR02293 family)